MAKSLCEFSAQKQGTEKYLSLVDNPRYLCKKCGERANKKKNLCKPKRL